MVNGYDHGIPGWSKSLIGLWSAGDRHLVGTEATGILQGLKQEGLEFVCP